MCREQFCLPLTPYPPIYQVTKKIKSYKIKLKLNERKQNDISNSVNTQLKIREQTSSGVLLKGVGPPSCMTDINIESNKYFIGLDHHQVGDH